MHMKCLLFVIAVTVSLSVKAQDKVTDYFYHERIVRFGYFNIPNQERIIIYHKAPPIMLIGGDDSDAGVSRYLRNQINEYKPSLEERNFVDNYLTSKSFSSIELSSDRIWSPARVVESIIAGTRTERTAQTILKLPKVGKIERWSNQNGSERTDYEARLITVNVCIEGRWQDANALEVKETTYYVYNGVNEQIGPIISYWVKGFGLLLQMIRGQIFMYNKNLLKGNDVLENSVNFKEVAYYDVEQRQYEQQEKEKAEQLRKFLHERETCFYDLKEHNDIIYQANEKRIFQIVDSIVRKHHATNIHISCADSVCTKYDGTNFHNIAIDCSESDYNSSIESEIKKALNALKFAPLQLMESYMEVPYPVHTQSRYAIDYYVKTDKENLLLKKKSQSIELLDGNADFYNNEKRIIDTALHDKGKYWITETKSDRCGIVSRNIEILEQRSYKNRFFIGYNYAKATPIGIMVGCTHIDNSKHWGGYVSLKMSTYQKFDKQADDDISQIEEIGYSRLGGVVGGTYSIKKFVHLYWGVGYGHCGIVYSNESRSLYYQATPIQGVETEVGIIVKPLKNIGLSIGYDAISNLNMNSRNRFYGEINLGISIFL